MSAKPKAAKLALQCPDCVYATGSISAFVRHLMDVHAMRPNQVHQIVERETKVKP